MFHLALTNPHEEDIFQVLENRNDLEYVQHRSSPSQELDQRDLSRVDDLQHIQHQDNFGNQDMQQQNSFDDASQKDPLYIVHFVPSPKPKVDSSTSSPDQVSTVSNDVLQKILSASKGAKPGTPQFVVFAPVPGEDDPKNQQNNMGIPGIDFFSKAPPRNGELDYEYEEELRKYQELLNSRDDPNLKETSRVGGGSEKSQTQVHKESVKVEAQNFSAGKAYQSHQQLRSPNADIGLLANEFTQQPYQHPTPQEALNYQNIAPVHSSSQLNYPQPNYEASQQPYYPNPHQQAANYPIQQIQPSVNQPPAVARSGQYEPLGISLNFGSGNNKGILSGGYSPLGVISSILSPVFRRPRLNLNGKVMFGVMLEKGVKFGENNKAHVAYG
ncbi:uncharacterized protein LOC118203682 isoform X2 [Stegodyphus dumicola]|uniref:uncharacterized protein LOC118203682 isoform X2 n=1 Tax=Stegodyphus dumicola TaxID=202533 RepID=UPI0015B28D5D|nr:uncharacterized protein LOC118203682 isoform X2 [Stegodyphus dumicola]